MAGVGRGALRPNTGGKHSFAIIALIVVILILGINYWSVTSKNRRLLAEYDKLRKSYKQCSEDIIAAVKKQHEIEKEEREKDKTLEDTRRFLADERINVEKQKRELTNCQRNLTATANNGNTLLSDCEASCDKRLNDLGIEKQHECDIQVSQTTEELKSGQLLAVTNAIEKVKHEASRNCNVLLEAELSKAQKEYQILKQQLDQVIAAQQQQQQQQQQQEVTQPPKDERQIGVREKQERASNQPGQNLSQNKPDESASPKNQQPVQQETQQKQDQQLQQQLSVNKSEQPQKLPDKNEQSDGVLTNQNVNGQAQQQSQKVNGVEEIKEKPLNQNVQQWPERTRQGVEAQEQQPFREKRQVETELQQQQQQKLEDRRRPIDAQFLNIPSDSLVESGRRILAPSAALSLKEQQSQEETPLSAAKSSQKAIELPGSSLNAPSDRQQLPARDAETFMQQQQQPMNLQPAASRGSVPVGPLNVIRPGVSSRQTSGLENGRVGRQSVFGPEKSVDSLKGRDGYDIFNADETKVRRVTKLSNDGIARVEVHQQLPDDEEQADVGANKVDEVAGDNDDNDDDGDKGHDGKVAEDNGNEDDGGDDGNDGKVAEDNDNKNDDGAKVAADNDNEDDGGDDGNDGKVAEDNDNKNDDGNNDGNNARVAEDNDNGGEDVKDQQPDDVKSDNIVAQNVDLANGGNRPVVR